MSDSLNKQRWRRKSFATGLAWLFLRKRETTELRLRTCIGYPYQHEFRKHIRATKNASLQSISQEKGFTGNLLLHGVVFAPVPGKKMGHYSQEDSLVFDQNEEDDRERISSSGQISDCASQVEETELASLEHSSRQGSSVWVSWWMSESGAEEPCCMGKLEDEHCLYVKQRETVSENGSCPYHSDVYNAENDSDGSYLFLTPRESVHDGDEGIGGIIVDEEEKLREGFECCDDTVEGESEAHDVATHKDEQVGSICAVDMSLKTFIEDDMWWDKESMCGQAKGFPPPITILANEKHPGLPSHMSRTFWRSVKKDGRFVLMEVQARPREFFQATRKNGRLQLSLIRPLEETDDATLSDAEVENHDDEMQTCVQDMNEDCLVSKKEAEVPPSQLNIFNVIVQQYGSNEIADYNGGNKIVTRCNNRIAGQYEKTGVAASYVNNEIAAQNSNIEIFGESFLKKTLLGSTVQVDVLQSTSPGISESWNCESLPVCVSSSELNQEHQPSCFNAAFGFDNALSPSQKFLPYAVATILPVV